MHLEARTFEVVADFRDATLPVNRTCSRPSCRPLVSGKESLRSTEREGARLFPRRGFVLRAIDAGEEFDIINDDSSEITGYRQVVRSKVERAKSITAGGRPNRELSPGLCSITALWPAGDPPLPWMNQIVKMWLAQ